MIPPQFHSATKLLPLKKEPGREIFSPGSSTSFGNRSFNYCCGVVLDGVVLLPLLVEPAPLGEVLEPELVVPDPVPLVEEPEP